MAQSPITNEYDMIQKKISKVDSFMDNAKTFPVSSNKKYRFTTAITGKVGKPYCAFVAVIILNEKGSEINRFIRWINDFSGKPKDYTIIFSTPPHSTKTVIAYRLNSETPLKAKLEIFLSDSSLLKLEELDDNTENFCDLYEPPRIPNLTEDQEDILEKNMVWVFGTPRSGSTWLCTQLLKSKETAIWDEPWIGQNLAYIRRFGIEGKHWNEFNGYFFSQKYKHNSWLPALRKFILARTFSETFNFDEKIIIKEPNGSLGSNLIMECLPNSKLIFLLRDGRDVVDSMIDSHREDSWNEHLKPLKTKEARINKIKQNSQMWQRFTNVVDITYQNHNPKLKLLVKYEDLRQKPFEELKKIYNFLEINLSDEEIKEIVEKYSFENIPDSQKGKGKFLRTATTGQWRENFTSEEQELMNSIISKKLEKYGYAI